MWLPFFPAFVYTERHALNSTDIILRVPHNRQMICIVQITSRNNFFYILLYIFWLKAQKYVEALITLALWFRYISPATWAHCFHAAKESQKTHCSWIFSLIWLAWIKSDVKKSNSDIYS